MVKAIRPYGLLAVLGISVLLYFELHPFIASTVPQPLGTNLEPALLFDTMETQAYLAAFPAKAYRIARVRGVGRFYVDDNPGLVKRQLRSGNPWEPEALKIITKYARRSSVALDIGAHVGTLSIPLSRQVGPKGRVYAFEPQREVFRQLVKNLELNGIQNVFAVRFAVGDRRSIIEMSPSVGDGSARVGSGGDKAEMRPIDDFGFSNVSFMKIDVEGYELNVLQGAVETIRRNRPAILVELLGYNRIASLPEDHKERIMTEKKLLRGLGYELRLAYVAGEPHYLATPQ